MFSFPSILKFDSVILRETIAIALTPGRSCFVNCLHMFMVLRQLLS